MNQPDFFLKFIEGFQDEEPRRCWRTKQIAIGTHTDSLLVKVSPPLSGKSYGLHSVDVEHVIVGPKYQGDSLFPVSAWPLDVNVFLPTKNELELLDILDLKEVRKIAFGEIYVDENRRTQPSGPRQTNPW